MRLKAVVEPRIVLEVEAPLYAITAPSNHHDWCHEANDLEIVGKLVGAPHLTVLSFESFSTPRLSVDLDQHLAANGFGFVNRHDCLL
jgi:hypothetical protein